MVYLNFLLFDGKVRILEALKHTDPRNTACFIFYIIKNF
jgi:hypothetical protein